MKTLYYSKYQEHLHCNTLRAVITANCDAPHPHNNYQNNNDNNKKLPLQCHRQAMKASMKKSTGPEGTFQKLPY
jgi:hypothetical protein